MTDKKKKKEFKFDSKKIPTEPGCYLYWDKDDKLLYVGKAKNLRKRVSSYFQKTKQSPKTALMVKKIARIETRCVNTEMEALILENTLIKEYRPKFNVLLRDDKNFLYLRVTSSDEPKLEITRRVLKDGSTYFGPKTSSGDFRKTIKFCQKYFGAKMVKQSQDYYINQLTGSEIEPEVYRANIERMKRFLKGQTKEVLSELQEKMQQFAVDKNFEAAARIRDTIQSIDESTQKQTVEFTDMIDRDFVHYVIADRKVYLVRLAFRQGKLRDHNQMTFSVSEFSESAEILNNFLVQFYQHVTEFPREIFLPALPEDKEVLENYLSENYFDDQRVEIVVPQKGDKKTILDLAQKNAQNFADKDKITQLTQAENFSKALPELAEALNLPEPPKRIECYDISHFAGKDTVASMVVFVDGKPKKSEYRRFKVKTLETGKIDDFASMEEVLGRRFKRLNHVETKPHHPDLIMKPVETNDEWKTYHDIREQELFKRYRPEVEYDREHKDETKKKNHPMIFVMDGEIIGTVRLDIKPKKQVIVRLMAIKAPLQKQKYGTQALELIEAWCQEQKAKHLVLNAQEEAQKFYEKLGFEKDYWPGEENAWGCVPMGKEIVIKKEKWELPDLVVIDGGKGQLSSVMKTFKSIEVEGFDPKTQVISLAKREEQIFRPGNSQPIELPLESPALQLLQRLRDEAHRFAISFNRSLRQKSAQKSILDEISGIGPKTKKELMQKFDSVSGIRNASDADLLKIVSKKQFNNLRRNL